MNRGPMPATRQWASAPTDRRRRAARSGAVRWSSVTCGSMNGLRTLGGHLDELVREVVVAGIGKPFSMLERNESDRRDIERVRQSVDSPILPIPVDAIDASVEQLASRGFHLANIDRSAAIVRSQDAGVGPI